MLSSAQVRVAGVPGPLLIGGSCRHARRVRVALAPCRAEPEQSKTDTDAEALAEILEQRAKGGKKKAKMSAMKGPGAASADAASNRVVWKEGELFPEGWEEMNIGQKFYQVYMGERGLLYWLQQAAWYSSIGLGVAWVIFRFVGPNLGLYKLANDIQTPNF